MKAEYAQAIASRTIVVQNDPGNKVDPDVRYMHAVVYPLIASLMYKGRFNMRLTASRMTDKRIEMLREDGFVVRKGPPDDKGALFYCIEWSEQKILDDDGEEKWVSAREFNDFAARMKALHKMDVNDGIDELKEMGIGRAIGAWSHWLDRD